MVKMMKKINKWIFQTDDGTISCNVRPTLSGWCVEVRENMPEKYFIIRKRRYGYTREGALKSAKKEIHELET